MARRPTAKDVAAELGVSVRTVSNAFGRPDQLSAELRERILATASRLGYAGPDPISAGLRRGRVGAIGVAYANRLSYAFDDPVARAVLAGMTAAAESARTGLLLLPGSAEPAERTRAVGTAILDGLIAHSLADDDPLLHTAIDRRLPLVVIDQPRPETLPARVPWVGVDDRSAAAELARHLLERGHRRLAVVGFGLHGSPVRGLVDLRRTAVTLAVSRDRLAGFRVAAEEYGLDWDAVPVHQGTDSTPEEGAAGARAVLATTPRPTALLCLSDRIAEGALAVADDLGLRVPDDLSVTGFDDADPTGAALGLTTVRQPHRLKGETAARALVRLIDGSGTAGSGEPLATEIVIRGSTGPASAN